MEGYIYIHNFHSKTGIIIDKNGVDYYIINSINDSLSGDIVKYEKTENTIEEKIISSIKKKFNFIDFKGFARIIETIEENNKIFGIINYKSKIQYGKKDNKWLYPLQSLNYQFPDTIIGTTKRYDKNQYAWAKIISRNCGKYDAVCEEIVGEVGTKNKDYEACLQQFGFKHKKIKVREKNIDFEQIFKLERNRIDLSKKSIFSIDSESTLDIDDAIHCEKIDENYIEIGIHIADPSYFLEREKELFDISLHNSSSFYFPHKRVDMLNKIFAEKYCSLNEGEYRFAMSTILKINKKTFKIVDIKSESSLIKNNAKLAYIQVDKFLRSENYKKLKIENDGIKEGLLILKNSIDAIMANNFPSYSNKSNYDNNEKLSRKLIECLMIINNSILGKKIYENYPNGLLRIHNINENKKKYSKKEEKFLNENENINDILRILEMEKGYYKKVYYLQKDDVKHDGLGLKYYTHFTSPIRRFPDLWNQILIKNNVDYQIHGLDVFNLNYKNYLFKLASRDNELVEIYHKYISNKYEKSIYEGVVVDILNNKVKIYVNDLKKLIDIKLINKNISDIIDIIDSKNSISLIKKSDKIEYKLSKFDKIKVKMCVHTSKMRWKDKLFFEIVEPSFSEWIL